MSKEIYLPIIPDSSKDWDELEMMIRKLFRDEIYMPILKEVGMTRKALHNAPTKLADALRSGRITFSRGTFSGRLSSQISRELRELGARFDRKTGTYKIELSSLPYDVRAQISVSASKWAEKVAKIDEKLAQILPDELAAKLKADKFFDKTIWKTEKNFQKSVEGITIAPVLTDYQRKHIASDWTNNLQLYIKEFTEKETKGLRHEMAKTVFAGDRYGSAVKTIQDSYGVSVNKAKFLARQETNLLMSKFKQTRYQEAGVEFYKWVCVAGSKLHPVRPDHKKNDGHIFRFDDPPTVNKQGDRKNPKQDYNCRCTARAMVNYRGQYTKSGK